MKKLHLLMLLIVALILQPACMKGVQQQAPPSKEAIEPSMEAVEPSPRDVTICILEGGKPDVGVTHVKADGRQRVCWKGHGQAYELRFKTEDWPFKEPPQRTLDDGRSVIDVPANAAGDLFTLKYKLSPGEALKTHSYEVAPVPATTATPEETPPGGPVIIGEG